MELVESFCRGKWPDQDLCEDAIFASENFVAVIDGVSDKSGLEYAGVSGGRWAASVVAGEFARLSPSASLADAERRLTAALASGQEALHPGWRERSPAGATIVSYSRGRNEIWRIGDGHYSVDGVANHGSMRLDEIAVAMRWAYIESLRSSGLSAAEVAADEMQAGGLVRPLLLVQHHLANLSEPHPLAYGVLNGTQVPAHLQEVVVLGASVREVAMSTDGYPELLTTLAATEECLKADLRSDPLRTGRHRGFIAVTPPLESFDDRAYARITTGQSTPY